MNDSKHRKGGWRWVRESISVYWVFGDEGGTEWCLPFKCPSSVQPVREERQCRWQLVTETAGCPTSPCLWPTEKWHLAPKKDKGKKPHLWLINTASQTPCLRQQETNATRTPGWHVRQYLLCHSPATSSSSFHLPLPQVFTHQRQGTGGCQLNQVTFPLFHFFHPKFEYEKGLSLTQSKTITLMTFGSHLIY